MAFDLASVTSDTRLRPPRIVLLGVEKIGKSTFAAGAAFADLYSDSWRRGYRLPGRAAVSDLQHARRSYVLHLLALLGAAQLRDGRCRLRFALEPLVWADTCKRNINAGSIEKVGGGYGKGYIEAVQVWRWIAVPGCAERFSQPKAAVPHRQGHH